MKAELTNLLEDCGNEINKIKEIVESNPLNPINQYLNKYVVIKACGTVECVFKSIIANYFVTVNVTQVQNFINKSVRESSANPTFDKICSMLRIYDKNWCKNFKDSIKDRNDADKIKSSLNSLVDNRNSFAHGKNVTATAAQIKEYYGDSIIILKLLDEAVK